MTAGGRDKRDGERGQILAMMAIALIALCALVAVAADMGFFSDYRRRMQTAADGAAMAGAEQVHGGDTSRANIQNEGYKGSASNGFTKDVDGTQVIVNWPPQSGPYANDGYVEAIITQPRPTTFMVILGFQNATVSARAVAGIKDSDMCILALNQTVTKAINMNGSFTIDAAKCRVADNSSDGDALDDSGGACMTAKSIAVTGTAGGNSSCFTPLPMNQVPREPDPLAGLAAPTIPTCTCPSGATDCGTSGSCFKNCTKNKDTWTLSPGVYCGGITLTSSAQATLQPGVYILDGGGLRVTGGATINGTGVAFYNTGTTSGPTKYDTLTINGGSGALKAPTSGPMAGILFFQDRTLSSTLNSSQLNQKNSVGGSPYLTLEGTLYFPGTPLQFEGGASPTSAAAYSILIADTITFTGGATFNNDFTGLPNGSPLKTVALAE